MIPFSQGSENLAEQAERTKELETGEICSEILSSGHGLNMAHMNSQQL